MTLTADFHDFERESYAGEHIVRLKIAAGEAEMFKGGLVAHGAAVNEVRHIDDLEAGNFAGMILQGGVAGDVVEVMQVGLAVVKTAYNAVVNGEGTLLYAEASPTASSSPADITDTLLNNCPIGQVNRVVNAATDEIVVLIQADGFR